MPLQPSLNQLTLAQSLKAIQSGDTTTSEIQQAVLDEIARKNTSLNCYLHVSENVSEKSEELDDSPLRGIPLAIKDNICTAGIPTTASSNVLKEFIPQYDATIVTKLKQAGAYIVGKTNLDAWAHGSSTETSDFGPTLNPRNTEYLPGGSSGGSAAAVAADVCIAAIGTETAGSIRQPSSWCGVVGLKPTYGRVSRYGIVAMASSTDSPGPITKTVEDAAILLAILAGNDPYDATTAQKPVEDYTSTLSTTLNGLKIGVMYQDIEALQSIESQYADVIKVLTELGATVEPASAMDPHYAISTYTIIQRGEVSSNLARYDGGRYGTDRTEFGDEAKRRILLGTHALSKGYADKYYQQADKVRALYAQDFEKLFNQYDVLISPTSPTFAQKIGATEGVAMFGEIADMLLEPSSIVGLPGINVPCYRDPKTNLFLGLNIMAPHFREDLCLKVGHAYEQATTWNGWVQS